MDFTKAFSEYLPEFKKILRSVAKLQCPASRTLPYSTGPPKRPIMMKFFSKPKESETQAPGILGAYLNLGTKSRNADYLSWQDQRNNVPSFPSENAKILEVELNILLHKSLS